MQNGWRDTSNKEMHRNSIESTQFHDDVRENLQRSRRTVPMFAEEPHASFQLLKTHHFFVVLCSLKFTTKASGAQSMSRIVSNQEQLWCVAYCERNPINSQLNTAATVCIHWLMYTHAHNLYSRETNHKQIKINIFMLFWLVGSHAVGKSEWR